MFELRMKSAIGKKSLIQRFDALNERSLGSAPRCERAIVRTRNSAMQAVGRLLAKKSVCTRLSPSHNTQIIAADRLQQRSSLAVACIFSSFNSDLLFVARKRAHLEPCGHTRKICMSIVFFIYFSALKS